MRGGRSDGRQKWRTAQGAVEEGALLEIRQQVELEGAKYADTFSRRIVPNARRQMPLRVVMMVGGQAELLYVVFALRNAGRLAGRLHRRQEQSDQDADDGDHDEQLDKREAAALIRS
jgi:hypothetical protein